MKTKTFLAFSAVHCRLQCQLLTALLFLNNFELNLDLHSVLVVPQGELEGLPAYDDAVVQAVADVAADRLDQLSPCLDLPGQGTSAWGLPLQLQTHIRPDTTWIYCLLQDFKIEFV